MRNIYKVVELAGSGLCRSSSEYFVLYCSSRTADRKTIRCCFKIVVNVYDTAKYLSDALTDVHQELFTDVRGQAR